jgi:flagellar hook-associated protein 2
MAANTSDIGLALLNSMGASRFDVATMAKVLAEADVAAQRTSLETRQQSLNFKLSGYDLLQQAFQGFNSQVSSLLSLDTFRQQQVTSSDANVLTATVTGQAAPGTYQIDVQQLAQAHTLATSADFASTSDVIGTGTLNITVGGVQHSLTIDTTNNTLEGLRSAVNSANIGVTATIVNTGSGYKLMFTSNQTGVNSAMTITVTDNDGNDTDNAGLSQLINANMTETVAAQDAAVVINGLTITRSTNVMDDVIGGLSLELKAADPGRVKTLTVQRDTSTAEQAVQDFVDLYNSLQDVFQILGSYSNTPTADDPTSGSLKGDSTLRLLKDQVRQMIAQPVSGATGAITSLADIGILTNRDGTLEFDRTKLQQALQADPEAVGKLFAASMSATDSLVQYVSSNDKTPEGTWDLFVSQAAQKASLNSATLGGSSSITLDSSNNTLDITVDGVDSNTITLATGTYTKAQLATLLQDAINRDSNIAAKGGKVSVQYDSTNDQFVITSDKYGSASSIEFTGGTLVTSGVAGWNVGDKSTGVDVGGQIKDPVTGNTYTFTGQGQSVRISDYALDGLPKGLEITIGGTATGSRGTLTFNRGVADRIVNAFNAWVSADGVVGQKIDNLHSKENEYAEQQKKIDERYQQLELRYRIQFGQLQAILGSFQQTQSYLAAQLAALQPQDK